MIKHIMDYLREENKKVDKRLDDVVMGIFDTLIRKPVLNAMVYEMRKAEHECRVNLLVYETVPVALTHENVSTPKSPTPHYKCGACAKEDG